ncbi:MAG TPA: hydroxyacid dehydrogenase [Xanthobacteraceae bacterium]|nr:hydroxyacid dehydrogenase [Xanthobacteraceae bacterium]
MKCLLVQPIHPAGVALLAGRGVDAVQASTPDMATVCREVADCDAAITRNAGFNRAAMQAGVRLQVLGNHGIGTDPVDLAYAGQIGLPVVFTPHSNVQSVAELAIAHMLAIAKRVREADRSVREGRFDYRFSRDFTEMQGKTLAIIGFGRIGRRTAEIARLAFGMRIIIHSPGVSQQTIRDAGFEVAHGLDEALAVADYVSLHKALDPGAGPLLDRRRLFAMKPGAALINTARGALVDGVALVEAVRSGHLRGAAVDVFEAEPLPRDHPFAAVEGIVLSPHIGGASEEAMERTALQVAAQVLDVLDGRRPEHLVNPQVWDRRRGLSWPRAAP